MTQEEFIAAIKLVVIQYSIDSVESNLIKPPGRQPQKKLLELSKWFANLNSEDKNIVREIVSESIETAVFGFLCVLDGVRTIEDGGEKGSLVLNFEKEGSITWLNNPNQNYLHELL